MKDKILENQNVIEKMLSVKETLTLLNQLNLLPWAKKPDQQQPDNKQVNAPQPAPKEVVNKEPANLKPAPEKNPADNKTDDPIYGLNSEGATRRFLESKAGKDLRAALTKMAVKNDEMIKDMLKKGLLKALEKIKARLAKLYKSKQKREKEFQKLLNHAYQEIAALAKHRKEAEQETHKNYLKDFPSIIELPAYKAIMLNHDTKMAVLQQEKDFWSDEIGIIDWHMASTHFHDQIRIQSVLNTEAFVADVEAYPEHEQVWILHQERQALENNLALQSDETNQHGLQAQPSLPLHVQCMHLQLAVLNQVYEKVINRQCYFNQEGQKVLTRAEAQYVLPNTKKLVKENGVLYMIDVLADLNILSQAAKQEASEHTLQQLPAMSLKKPLAELKQNHEEAMSAYAQKRSMCVTKWEKCDKNQELLKAQTNMELGALAELHPMSPAPKPVPTPKSSSKPNYHTAPAPKPHEAYKRLKAEYNFFRNENLTMEQLYGHIERAFPDNLRNDARLYVQQAMARAKPGDIVPPLVRAELEKLYNQPQAQANTPLKMTPFKLPGTY